ncbi:MAG: CvpA family protein [Pseudomonadota bacterium]
MQFTYVDAAVAVITLLSAFLAYSRGLTRELFAIGGWIVAGLLAFYFAPAIEPLIREAPVVGQFLSSSCVISMITAFSLIVAAALLVLAVFTPIFSSIILESAIGPLDRMLGFLFGVVRGIVLIAVAYLVYTNLSGGEAIPALDGAASKPIFDEAARLIEQYRPEEMPAWFSERIDALMAPCTGETPTPTAPAADGNTTDS